MPSRTNNQRYLLWLALGTAAMALAMASLLVFELAQKRAIERSNAIRSDSLTALAFQFEREYLRLRQSMGESLAGGDVADPDALSFRYDIFQSRLTLLRESPSVALLTAREEYRNAMPRLEAVALQMDEAMAMQNPSRATLLAVLDELNGMGVEVQNMTLAASSEVARLLESQSTTMQEQNDLIVKLTIAQLVLLVLASGALVVRHRRMEAERQALERLTDDLRDARYRAEAANRGKSQFLANMSHELRTPFNGLMGMLGLLHTTPLTAQQADYIETAQASASHLLTLLNDVLDVSALETGKLTLKPAHCDLDRLLADVQALMHPLAKAKGLEFHLQRPVVPLQAVLADETRLKQILFNLVNNAIKFTDAGQVCLTVAQSLRADASVELAIAIQDTGIGMDTKAMERLFQRFSQVDGSSTRRFGGTGLGLEVSQSLARMMQGEITVSSVPGQGSTFTVRVHLPLSMAPESVPVAVAESVPMDVPPSATAQVTQEQGPLGQVATAALPAQANPAPTQVPMRVLVVEDHPINQKLVGALLGRMDCQTTFCENGQLAVEQVQQHPFDLVLMDVNMPVMDGLTATRQIRALPGTVSTIPVVVLTADVMNDARDAALAAGADDFLSKPVKFDQLRSAVVKYSNGKLPPES
jgi:signal transduction histidine kinase/ActR/RegA family two-component response regulator